MTPRLVLVGPPGSGKTTVGQLVAEQLDLAFLDTDDLVESTAGSTVAELFIDQGEEAFRVLEHAAVAQALSAHSGVLALGGGAVIDPETRIALKGHRVVLLAVGLSDAARRVGLNRDRPLLLGNVRAQLGALMAAREPLYAQVAVDTVSTDGRTPEEVAADVVALLAGETS